MKINSKELFDYINNLENFKKVKFKVYYDDCYTTEVLWNGEDFEWESGMFTSGEFFSPLCDFEPINEDEFEDIDEWGKGTLEEIETKTDYKIEDLQKYIEILMETQNQLIKNQKKIIERLKNER